MKEEIKCKICAVIDDTVKERTIKENGVLGYFDVKVLWCDKCTNSHNRYLLSSWG